MRAGDLNHAESIARGIGDKLLRALSLARAAVAVAEAGEHDRARELAKDAEAAAEDIDELDVFTPQLVELAAILARFGKIEAAEGIASGTGSAEALTEVAAALVRNGDRRRALDLAADAERTARSVGYTRGVVDGLTRVAGVMTLAGDRRRAIELIEEAEIVGRDEPDGSYRSEALRMVAAALAAAGEHERALEIVRDIANSYYRTDALLDLADKAGDSDRVLRLVDEVDIGDLRPNSQLRALTRWVVLIEEAGDHDLAIEAVAEATELLEEIDDPDELNAGTLAQLAATIERFGDHKLAARHLTRALVMDLSTLWWLTWMSESFPSLLGDTLDVLASHVGRA
jgi:tetratricopeptide (TPR) repeat protein